ncbi:ADP-ribosylation factor 4 [Pelomyxa schiedti]|nr:ADP-ribosylation factor 4 [Pelomyxa schiedti]
MSTDPATKQQHGSEDNTHVRVVMVGLDDSGKSALLYRQLRGEVTTTTPTDGFNVETIQLRNRDFDIWDLGGGPDIRRHWPHFLLNTRVLIWVVDAHNHGRIIESCTLLHEILTEARLHDSLLLVLANKQDLPGNVSKSELADMLELNNLVNRKWFIQPTSAIDGTGFVEGLEWAYSILS